MNKIPFALGTAAGVAAEEQRAEASTSQSARGQAVFAGLVVARRGKPFTVLSINADNLTTKLGEPLHPRTGVHFEPIRHLAQATMGGRGYAVRVVPSDMRIPVIRLKETNVQQAPKTVDFNLSTCTMTADKTTIKGDGKDKVTVAFTAKDSAGNLLTGLTGIQFQSISQIKPTMGDMWEVNGSYFVEVTANRAMPFMLIVLNDSYRIGTFSVNVDVAPAIVSPDESSITITPDVIDDDGHDFATVTFTALDEDGNAVTGVGNIDFMINSSTSVVMSAISEPQPGVYTVRVFGTSPGTISIFPRQNKVVLAPLQVDVRLMDVTTTGKISPTTSQFDIFPTVLYGDDKDIVTITFDAIAANGAMIKGIKDLTFRVETATKTEILTPVEASSGVYRAQFHTTDFGDATVTPVQGTTDIANLKAALKVMQAIPVVPSLSTLTMNKVRMVNNGTDVTTLTATLLGAGGIAAAAARQIEFEVVKGQATLGQYSESKPGILTVSLTSRYTGDIEVIIKQYGVQIGTLSATVFSAPVPALNPVTSSLALDKYVIQENGTDEIQVTFTAKDAQNWAMSGLSSLRFVVTGYQNGGVTITNPVESASNNGVYTAKLSATKRGSGSVTVYNSGVRLGSIEVPFGVTPTHGVIEIPNSDITLSKTSILANNRDKVTVSVALLDGFKDAITGRTDVTLSITGLTGIVSDSPTLVETTAGSGIYTTTLHTLSDGIAVIRVMAGGVTLSLPDRNLTCIRVRGIVDPSVSTMTIIGSPIYDNNAQQAIAQFAAIDGLGNPVTSLSVTFDVPNGSNLTVGNVSESNGVYTAQIRGTVIGTFSIDAEVNGTPVAGASADLTVRAAPVVDVGNTIFSHSGTIVADGNATLLISVDVRDQYNQKMDASKVTLRKENLPNVTVAVSDNGASTGVVIFAVSGTSYFSNDGTLYAQYNGKDIDATTKAYSFHVTPAPGVIDISKAATSLVIHPAIMDGNNRDTATLTLSLMDGLDKRVTNIASELEFRCSLTGVNIKAITESGFGTGMYQADVTATVGGNAVFTAYRNNKQIGTLNVSLALNDVSGIVSASDSYFDLSDTSVFASGIGADKSVMTLEVKDALLQPQSNLNVGFNSDKPGMLIFTTAQMVSDGEYTAEVTSTHPGDYIIWPVIDSVEYPSMGMKMTFKELPKLDITNPGTGFTVGSSKPANGTDHIDVVFTAYDQYGNLFPDLVGLTLSLTRASGDSSGITSTRFTNNQDGTYTAKITSSKVVAMNVQLMLNGTLMAYTAKQASFVALHGVITSAFTSMAIAPKTIKGNGIEEATITITAKDAYNDVVTGLTTLTVDCAPPSSTTTITGVTERGNGVYEATLKSTDHGHFTINLLVGGVGLGVSDTLAITDMRGVLDDGRSTIAFQDGQFNAVLSNRSNFTPTIQDTELVEKITFEARDLFGSPVTGLNMGRSLKFVQTSGTSTPNIIAGSEESPGTYTMYIWSRSVIPDLAYAVEYNNKQLSKNTGAIHVNAATPVDLTHSVVSLSKTTITGNGSDTCTVTATLVDAAGNPITGVDDLAIALTPSDVSNHVGQFTESGNGVYVASITSTSDSPTFTLSVNIGAGKVTGNDFTLNVTNLHGISNIGESSITLSSASLTAVLSERVNFTPATNDRKYVATITVILKDFFGTEISGLTMGAGKELELVQASGSMDMQFIYSGELRSGIYRAYVWVKNGGSGTIGIKVKGSRLVGEESAIITATDAAPIDNSRALFTVSKTQITGNDTDSTTLTLTVKDTNGYVVSGLDNVSFSTSPVSTKNTMTSVVENNGVYSATLTSKSSGQLNVMAYIGTTQIGSNVISIINAVGIIAPSTSSFVTNKTAILTALPSRNFVPRETNTAYVAEIKLTVKDIFGDAVQGLSLGRGMDIDFYEANLASGLNIIPLGELQDGVYSAYVYATKEQNYSIGLKYQGASFPAITPVRVNAVYETLDANRSTVNITPDRNNSSKVVVQLHLVGPDGNSWDRANLAADGFTVNYSSTNTDSNPGYGVTTVPAIKLVNGVPQVILQASKLDKEISAIYELRKDGVKTALNEFTVTFKPEIGIMVGSESEFTADKRAIAPDASDYTMLHFIGKDFYGNPAYMDAGDIEFVGDTDTIIGTAFSFYESAGLKFSARISMAATTTDTQKVIRVLYKGALLPGVSLTLNVVSMPSFLHSSIDTNPVGISKADADDEIMLKLVLQDANGNSLVGKLEQSTISFDVSPKAGDVTIEGTSGTDYYIAKFKGNGGGNGDVQIKPMVSGQDFYIYLTIFIENKNVFDPSKSTLTFAYPNYFTQIPGIENAKFTAHLVRTDGTPLLGANTLPSSLKGIATPGSQVTFTNVTEVGNGNYTFGINYGGNNNIAVTLGQSINGSSPVTTQPVNLAKMVFREASYSYSRVEFSPSLTRWHWTDRIGVKITLKNSNQGLIPYMPASLFKGLLRQDISSVTTFTELTPVNFQETGTKGVYTMEFDIPDGKAGRFLFDVTANGKHVLSSPTTIIVIEPFNPAIVVSTDITLEPASIAIGQQSVAHVRLLDANSSQLSGLEGMLSMSAMTQGVISITGPVLNQNMPGTYDFTLTGVGEGYTVFIVHIDTKGLVDNTELSVTKFPVDKSVPDPYMPNVYVYWTPDEASYTSGSPISIVANLRPFSGSYTIYAGHKELLAVEGGTMTTPIDQGSGSYRFTVTPNGSKPYIKIYFNGTEISSKPVLTSRSMSREPDNFFLSNSALQTEKNLSSGDGDTVDIAFIARDIDLQPIEGLSVTFRADNPLVSFSPVERMPKGIYMATMTTHSFNYDVTITALVDGVETDLTAVVVVAPQQFDDQPQEASTVPAVSTRSANSLYPVIAPADGVSQMVATLNPVDKHGNPIFGADFLLVAQPGCVAVDISPTEEKTPGTYTAVITSNVKGAVILAWYCDGVFIQANQRGAFSDLIQDYAAAEPELDDAHELTSRAMLPRVQVAPAAPAAPVYIQVVKDTIGPDETLQLEPDDLLVIAADDGDNSINRMISIAPDVAYPKLWDLKLIEVNNMGIASIIEMLRFSLDHNATDAAGNPLWLPVRLENAGSRLAALVKPNSDFPDTFKEMPAEAFVGGYDGTLSTLSVNDYRKALRALEASTVNYTAVLSLGVYDQDVLTMLAQHARAVRVDMFADVPPAYNPIEAMQFAASLGLGMFSNVSLYHFPYSSRDVYTREQVVFGLSGDAFVAKARGVTQVQGIGGWHFSPAGESRGSILRRSIQPLYADDAIDREEYVRLRINPVAPGLNGMWQIDDSLTTYQHENGLHYQHVSSVLNALARDINDICSVLKHEPGENLKISMEREIPLLMDEYVRCGALVMPKDTTQDAFPYKFSIESTEFDGWRIRYGVCVVGTARRIMCEPVEIR
ncbi:invasin domain 3-containing protein [Citrobacter werkmanii]|uniref:invasin domain 3-containing protein n=1 Tax=Citrobacter werkmanii TaxID=67827 RepID=UPI0037C5DE68